MARANRSSDIIYRKNIKKEKDWKRPWRNALMEGVIGGRTGKKEGRVRGKELNLSSVTSNVTREEKVPRTRVTNYY